jgi:cell division protease FtsH
MNLRNMAIWAAIVVVAFGVWSMMNPGQGGARATSSEISYSELVRKVQSGEVTRAIFQGSAVQVSGADPKVVSTAVVPADSSDLIKQMQAQNVNVTIKPAERLSLVAILLNAFPVLLLIGVWIFFMRQMQGGARGAMGFGKSKAKLLTEPRAARPSRTSPASTRPRKNCRKSSTS